MKLTNLLMKTVQVTIILAGTLTIVYSCKHEPILPPGENINNNNNVNNNNNNTYKHSCSADTAYFRNDVLPLIISNCAKSGCHDAQTASEGVVLTDFNNIIRTGRVRAGNPSNSKLYQMIVTSDMGDRMPPYPNQPLTKDQINLIYKWISQGAKNNFCDDTSGCDLSSVTYSGSIKPVLQTYCTGCHSGSVANGGIDLSLYTGVQTVALNGRLSGAINHLSGYNAMPQGTGKLDDCTLRKFDKWIKAGAPNN